ncbi:MAG: SWIM zinc finger family protein [Verrucomicrobia bacterium]|nr:SWIM zinc finger family protein [Verrucomicrobiota bacterium]
MGWGWTTKLHVTGAERRRRAQKAAEALEKKGQKMNPVRIEGRTICRSFWGKAWCQNLESYSDYANRLPRGRTYVRNGSIVDFQIAPGTIRALVSGSDLYRVTVKIEPVQMAQWKSLKTECAGRVGSLMDLLRGKLSGRVMEIITRRETGLFPRPAEIGLECSCPDWAGMCKHVAATLYAVGARLDESPELLFLLRGADHFELVTEATESVPTGVSIPAEGSATLTAENLQEVFGIEIEPATVEATDVSVLRPPKARNLKQSVPGSRSKRPKAAGPKNAKAPSSDERPAGIKPKKRDKV